MMETPMALPQYAQQGAMGYQDPGMMQQQMPVQPGMQMPQQGFPQ